MKYSELTPEEINALCAEVDGQQVYRDASGKPTSYLVWHTLPKYLGDMNLCMGLVATVTESGHFCLEHWDDNYQARFSFGVVKIPALAEADTPQEAIIKAVLIATGKIEEE